MAVEIASEESLERGASLLKSGELVIFPTETVYGLGASALSESAVSKIFALKGRPSSNPLIVHVAGIEDFDKYTKISKQNRDYISKLSQLFPGPLSLVLPSNELVLNSVRAGLPSLAIRVPANDIALELIKRSGLAIAAPSANPSSKLSPTSAEQAAFYFGNEIPLILDGGPCSVGIESTILDLSSPKPRVLRHGVISAEYLGELLSIDPADLLYDTHEDNLLSPGMLKHHYAPNTPLLFLDEISELPVTKSLALIRFSNSQILNRNFATTISLPLKERPEAAARELYRSLWELDRGDFDFIVVERPGSLGIERAILDRLTRAHLSPK